MRSRSSQHQIVIFHWACWHCNISTGGSIFNSSAAGTQKITEIAIREIIATADDDCTSSINITFGQKTKIMPLNGTQIELRAACNAKTAAAARVAVCVYVVRVRGIAYHNNGVASRNTCATCAAHCIGCPRRWVVPFTRFCAKEPLGRFRKGIGDTASEIAINRCATFPVESIVVLVNKRCVVVRIPYSNIVIGWHIGIFGCSYKALHIAVIVVDRCYTIETVALVVPIGLQHVEFIAQYVMTPVHRAACD